MNIYFAGSIRGGREDRALYLEIIELLRSYGRVLTEHVGDAELTPLGEGCDDRAIHDRDLSWLKEAECVVAEVTVPSLGVGYEIGKAAEWGKPVLCLFRPDRGRALSAMIAGSPGLKVCEYQEAADLEKIFDEFFGTRRGRPRFSFINSEEVEWRASAFAAGVEVKDLCLADGRAMQLVRFPPGTVFPLHGHEGPEFVYILEGELIQNGNRLRGGWASVASAGTVDDDVRSETGCTFLIIYTE